MIATLAKINDLVNFSSFFTYFIEIGEIREFAPKVPHHLSVFI
jgi:hypothetical protein